MYNIASICEKDNTLDIISSICIIFIILYLMHNVFKIYTYKKKLNSRNTIYSGLQSYM